MRLCLDVRAVESFGQKVPYGLLSGLPGGVFVFISTSWAYIVSLISLFLPRIEHLQKKKNTPRFPGRRLRFHNPQLGLHRELDFVDPAAFRTSIKNKNTPRFPGRRLRSHNPGRDYIVTLNALFPVAFRTSIKKEKHPRFPGRRLRSHNPGRDYIVTLISLTLPRFVHL